MDEHTELRGEQRESVFRDYVSGVTPLGRPQTPEDIGEAVVYLAGADNVTGIAVNVSGGSVMY